MELKIYIPTNKRVWSQVTLWQLPSNIQRNVMLVCSPDEVELHRSRGVTCTILPVKVKCIGEKRDWIMKHAANHRYKRILMLDDDLTLQRRRPDMRITNCTAAEVVEALRWMDDKLKTYAHATFGMRFLGFANTAKEVVGARAVYALGYDVAKFNRAKADFTVVKVMEDFHVTLQMLRAGYANVLSLEWRVSPRESNRSGGCSGERTKEIIEASARKLAKLHAPHVKLREKKAWKGMGDTQLDVTVAWQKALKYGLELR